MFEILEHTADTGFRARARSLPELFESAAEALISIATEAADALPHDAFPLTAEGDSREALLVNWLSEVLYRLDGERLALRHVRVHQLTDTRVAGEAYGEPRDPARHRPRLVVKGVTWHQLRIEQSESGWWCEVYVDV